MNWWYGAGQRRNEKFAKACVKAKLHSKKTFKFMNSIYIVEDHIKSVMEDIDEGRYQIMVGKAKK